MTQLTDDTNHDTRPARDIAAWWWIVLCDDPSARDVEPEQLGAMWRHLVTDLTPDSNDLDRSSGPFMLVGAYHPDQLHVFHVTAEPPTIVETDPDDYLIDAIGVATGGPHPHGGGRTTVFPWPVDAAQFGTDQSIGDRLHQILNGHRRLGRRAVTLHQRGAANIVWVNERLCVNDELTSGETRWVEQQIAKVRT